MTYYDWMSAIDDDDDYDMLCRMNELRMDDPVLWLVLVMGPITPKNIAVKLGWPVNAVIWELRQLKTEGKVVDEENARAGNPMVWKLNGDTLADEAEWLREKTRLGGWSNPRPESRDDEDENGGD